MIELLAIPILLTIVYIVVGVTYYKRGYKDGLKMGEAIGYHKRGRQDQIATLEAEMRAEMKADDLYKSLPPEQSSR